jgi:hypothetical protein
MATPSDRPLVLGWKEYVYFPAWGNCRVKAKIDTGARTTALDALSYTLRETEDRGVVAELRLALDPRHPERIVAVETPVLRTIVVSNSNGMREQRPLIETDLRVGTVTKRVRMTVTSRAGMRFRMILGRKALEGDFVVDVSRKYVQRSRKR